MTSQKKYSNTYNEYVNLLKDNFSKLSDNENKIQYDIYKLDEITGRYIPFDSNYYPSTDDNIELTIQIYTISNNYETFDSFYINKGKFLPMLSPHHLKNKLFFSDGTKKYELNNILYRSATAATVAIKIITGYAMNQFQMAVKGAENVVGLRTSSGILYSDKKDKIFSGNPFWEDAKDLVKYLLYNNKNIDKAN